MDVEWLRVAGGLPSLVYSDAHWNSKERKQGRPRNWKWAEFKPANRADGLQLKHWIRDDEDMPPHGGSTQPTSADSGIISYTSEEYSAHLEDSKWTREETDRLFDLCRQYHLRFIVVHDRFDAAIADTTNNNPKEEEASNADPKDEPMDEDHQKIVPKTFTVEDLKERYYDVVRKLETARAAVSGTPLSALGTFVFDKEREVRRKEHLQTLYNRSEQEVQEEQLLFYELQRRKLYERQWAVERDYLVRIHSNHELASPMPLPPIPGIADSLDGRKKMRRPDSGHEVKRKSNIVPIAPEATALARKETPPGAFLRSHRLLAPRASNLQAKFRELLDEYGLSQPPSMPNAKVCDVADEIRGNLMVLLDMKKSIEKLEHDMISLKERKRMLLAGEGAIGRIGNNSGGGGGGGATGGAGLGVLDSGGSGDEYDEAEARKRKKSSGGSFSGGGSGLVKKTRLH